MKQGFKRLKGLATAGAVGAGLLAGGNVFATHRSRSSSTSDVVTIISRGKSQSFVEWSVRNTSVSFIDSQSSTFFQPLFGIFDASLINVPKVNASTSTVANGVRSDAFDIIFDMSIGTSVFSNPANTVDVVGDAITTDVAIDFVPGIDAQVQYYFAPALPVVRALYTFTNTTTADITISPEIFGNLGSDADTKIQATSDGNLISENNDLWFLSDSNGVIDFSLDPVVAISRYGLGAPVVALNTITLVDGDDVFGLGYELVIPPGETQRIMLFAQLTFTVDDGVAGAANFEGLAAVNKVGLLTDLTTTQISEIVNYGADRDLDGALDVDDAFPDDPTETKDTDLDLIGDNADNCPVNTNADQLDTDGDGAGDVCDAFPNNPAETKDTDLDLVGDNADNCPINENADQLDGDGDGAGDVCDAFPEDPTETIDTDGDGVGDNGDAFPNDPAETKDADLDLIGDNADNCPVNENADQLDGDGDGVGDVCDAFPEDATETLDTDEDGVGDNADVFPNDPTETTDTDLDFVGDNSDNCPIDANADQLNSDGDSAGDVCDAFPQDPTETKDTDVDGVGDNADAFPNDPTETKDTDGDGVGDNADVFPLDPTEIIDSDGDTVGDNADAFPNDPTETLDTDGDGIGDNTDAFPIDRGEILDSDGDGVGNNEDAFSLDPTETKDSDLDGVGDNSDAFPFDPDETEDSDRDGVGDNADVFPLDAAETLDTDGDGVGDNADDFPQDPTRSVAPEPLSSNGGVGTLSGFMALFGLLPFLRRRRKIK